MIRLFFGNPGCGKTTHAVKVALKEGRPVFHNIAGCTVGTYISDIHNLGRFTLPKGSLLIIDESGIVFNNRQYKSLSMSTIEWLKLHRHYKVDVDFYSQSWDDTDITVRRLVDKLYYLRRLGPFTLVRLVTRCVMVDKDSHQIIDGYDMPKLIRRFVPYPWHIPSFKILYRPKYYRYFDSFNAPALPVRGGSSHG